MAAAVASTCTNFALRNARWWWWWWLAQKSTEKQAHTYISIDVPAAAAAADVNAFLLFLLQETVSVSVLDGITTTKRARDEAAAAALEWDGEHTTLLLLLPLQKHCQTVWRALETMSPREQAKESENA